MSIPPRADLPTSQDVQVPEQKLMDSDQSNPDLRAEKTCLHHDEYTTILKKHLSVVETQLSRLKNPGV